MEEIIPDCGLTIESNWNTLGGCDYKNSIEIKSFNEDVFIKPELSEVLNEEKACLLSPLPTCNELCEFHIRTNGRFKFAALSFVCSSPKIELFLSHQYEETLYGLEINPDETDSENTDLCNDMRTYRYDKEIFKSGITDLFLKFITQKQDIIIYGIIVFVAPNPNGVTTLNPSSINIKNVEELLKNSNSKHSLNAEKCKLFLESYSKHQGAFKTNTAEIYEQLTGAIGRKIEPSDSNVSQDLEKIIRKEVNSRISALETKLEARLADLETAQNAKLDKIIELLGNKIQLC